PFSISTYSLPLSASVFPFASCAKVGREKELVVRRVKQRPLYVLFLEPQPRERACLVVASFEEQITVMGTLSEYSLLSLGLR
ncbi:hypothetical protein DNTS_000375, partial [Danionella cerebrum]